MPGKRPQYFKVGKVLDHRSTDQGVEYKVHWANYPSSQDTWEPEENLQHCQEFIQEYIMQSFNKVKPRRSARLAPSEVHLLKEFEEEAPHSEVRKSASSEVRKSASPKRPRTRQRTVKLEKPTPRPVSPRRTRRSTSKDVPPRSVTLRSTTLTYSSDEDDNTGMRTRSSPRSTHLSETGFKKRIHDIAKKKVVSSTPLSEISTTTTNTKVKLNFDRPLPRRSTRRVTRSITTSVPSVSTDTTTVEEEEDEIVEEESDSLVDEEDGVIRERTPIRDHSHSTVGKKVMGRRRVIEKEAWIGEDDSDLHVERIHTPRLLFQIGWRECVLALLVTGVGAAGYVCHVTDYCNFC